MFYLKPFAAISFNLRLSGQITRRNHDIDLRFELDDPDQLVQESLQPGLYTRELKRANELWKTTCFEAFFGPLGSKTYWEVNLSPQSPTWNLYRFEEYRQPQPPTTSHDYEPVSIQKTSTTLDCRLQAQRDLPKGPWQANLTAVLMTHQGPIYMAVQHAVSRADFHDRSAYCISI